MQSQLAEVIKKESFDIIFCGIESCDYNGTSVGGMLSELLNMPSVSAVSFFDIENGKIKLKREIDGGHEAVNYPNTFYCNSSERYLQRTTNSFNERNYGRKNKTFAGSRTCCCRSFVEFVNYEYPKPKAACKKIDPENVKELVQLLHNEAKVI